MPPQDQARLTHPLTPVQHRRHYHLAQDLESNDSPPTTASPPPPPETGRHSSPKLTARSLYSWPLSTLWEIFKWARWAAQGNGSNRTLQDLIHRPSRDADHIL